MRKLLRRIGRALGQGPRPAAKGKGSPIRPQKSPRQVLDSGVSRASFEHRWARLVVESVHEGVLAELVGTDPGDLDGALRRLFPQLENKTIEDLELQVPASIPFVHKTFPTRELCVPLDWEADPVGVRDDRLWLQSLSWLDSLYTPGGKGLWRATYVVVDWHDRALKREPALELTWDEHAMAARLDRTWRLLLKYMEVSETLNRRVLLAAVTIVLSHLYALAVESLYAAGHNHGLMQDRTLLVGALRLPALLDSGPLSELAEQRLLEHQVRRSVTTDFIHTENSPSYQWMYVRMLTAILADAYTAHGRAAPAELSGVRDGLLDTLVYLLQPNLSPPQFGDSLNGSVSRELRLLLRQASSSVPIEPAVCEHVTYVLSNGASGVMPPSVDRVFLEGGFAAFRESWGGDSPSMRITAHFKCSRLSNIHYHQDETSFEIYGYGEELVVDSGRYNNDRTHPLSKYGVSAHAHNVLIVDGCAFERAGERSRIVRSGGDETHVWVQGSHDYYRERGVTQLVRTFAYLKPNVFFVLDAVRATGSNRFEQHFHLHPSFTAVEHLASGGVAARRADGVGLMVVPCDTAVQTRTVCGDAGPEQSWYFPRENEAQPTTDVVLRHDMSAGTHYFAALLVVSGPGDALDPVRSMALTVGETSIDVQFRHRERAHRLLLRAGPFAR